MAAPNPFQNLIIGFAPGERIFTEGEVGTTMFVVQSGRVRLFRESAGKTVAIAEMERGDFFGEMSLLEASARNMSADAIETVELIEINSTTFDRMIRSNIEIAVRMLRKLSGRLQRAESLLAIQRAERDTAAQEAAAVPAAMVGAHAAGVPLRPARPIPAGLPSTVPGASSGATASPRPVATQSVSSTRMVAAAPPVAAVPQGVPPPTAPPHVTTPSSFPRPTPAPAGSLSATRPPTPTGGAPLGPRAAPPLGPPARTPGAHAAPGHGPRLVSESGESVFPILSGEALLGRYDPVTETQPEVDLTLIDIKRSVSRRHARITSKDGSLYLVEEVGALNGTFVNGVKLITGKPAPLNNEDRISLGTVNLVFRI